MGGDVTDHFEDYYELLELSPNANQETIERVFRYFATKWHPDAGGDKAKFSLLIRAFETLRDPATRAGYDAKYQARQQHADNLIDNATAAGNDAVDRHKLLELYYARRRQNHKNPALGITTVQHLMKCPLEILEFHLWYFREKGWLDRADNGGFAITAEGVDRVESNAVAAANHQLLALKHAKARPDTQTRPSSNRIESRSSSA